MIPFSYLSGEDFKAAVFRYRAKKPTAIKISDSDIFSGVKQAKLLRTLLQGDLPKKTTRILLASSPTDDIAMVRAIQIVLAFQRKNKPVNVVDLSKYEDVNEYFASISRDGRCKKFSLLVLHSILPCSTEERFQLASDYIKRVNCPILLVSGGLNPIDVSSELGLSMSAIIHFVGAKQV